MVPSGIIFHREANVFLGSFAFLSIDLRAMFLLLYIIVLSPIEKCNSDMVILRGKFLLSGRFSELSESMRWVEAMERRLFCTEYLIRRQCFRPVSTFLLGLG